VAAEPGRCTAAAGKEHGQFRASHADRENVIDTLKAAFVQGRLTLDELDERVGRTLVSRTHRDLAALTADIPAGLATAFPPRTPAGAQARPLASRVARVGAFAAIGPPVLVAAFVTSNDATFKWLITAMIVYYLTLMVTGAMMLDSRHHRPSRGQLPRKATALQPYR
jgi:hypothetical protein